MKSIVNKALKQKKLKIVFFGDSITAGFFESFENFHGTCEPEYGFPERLRRLLQTVFPDTELIIVNSGVGGDTAESALGRMKKDVLEFRPDLVVVNFMLNDARILEKEKYAEALRRLFRMVKENGSEGIFLTECMGCTKITSPVRKDIAEEMMSCQNSGKVDEFYKTAVSVAKEEKIMVCDIYAQWKKMAESGIDTNRLLTNRINHPMREMHALFAAALFHTIIFDEGIYSVG